MVSDICNAFVMASSEALFIYSPRGIATVVNIYHVDVFDACLSSSFYAALTKPSEEFQGIYSYKSIWPFNNIWRVIIQI